MKAHLRKIRISPKKANLVAGTVRGKSVNEALRILELMPKKGADILYKVVHSAASNAKANFKQSIDDLYITQILVTKGPTYKRSLPISRGRTHPIAKRTAHITVEVGIPLNQEESKRELSAETSLEKKPAIKASKDSEKAKIAETTEKKTTQKKVAAPKKTTAKKQS